MHDKLNYLDFENAIFKSLELVNPTQLCELIPINNSIGRVLSSDIICKKNLPAFNNSAMDGFAIKFCDAGKTLKIKKSIFAGDKIDDLKESLKENECYKIMTGSKVPSCVDTIIPIENCSFVSESSVKIPEDIKKGSNLRFKGEEQKEGDVILKKGEVINSSIIALLASQGIMIVEVYKKITIAILSTGNELKEPWENSTDEEIYNCNSYALISQLKEKNFEATYCGVIPDDLEKSVEFIRNLKNYDVIISTGGISMGDADFVGEAFLKNGLDIAFHGVNIKPGRPIMMGKMRDSLVICLPGNPLTAMINIYLFVIPMLKKLQGEVFINHGFVKATNKNEFKTKKGRVNIVLGKVKNSIFEVARANKYGSGMITVLYESNAILVTSEEVSSINENQEVKLILLDGHFFEEKADFLN